MSALANFWIEEPVADVFRLGTAYVGFYLLAEGGKYTVVDSGLPGYWDHLTGFLRSRGSTMDDIEAQVLTHHHPDHRGNTPRLQEEAGARVHIHHADVAALTERTPPPMVPLWRPAVLRYLLHLLRRGAPRMGTVVGADVFGDGELLDLPGQPRVVHVPGHTRGHSCFFLESKRAVLTGDALMGMDLMTGEIGPRIPPSFLNEDSETALSSLSSLEKLDADLALTVHGPHWTGPIADTVRKAREVGVY